MNNNIKKHQTLIELENLVNRILNIQTNLSYANNKKFAYKMSWAKGEAAIHNEETGHRTKDYYVFKVFIIDKTEIIQNTINLVESFHVVQPLVNSNKLYESALEKFLIHSVSHLALNKLNEYHYNKSRPVDEIIKEREPKKESDIIIPKSNLIL
jgi:hypothetical protein